MKYIIKVTNENNSSAQRFKLNDRNTRMEMKFKFKTEIIFRFCLSYSLSVLAKANEKVIGV